MKLGFSIVCLVVFLYGCSSDSKDTESGRISSSLWTEQSERILITRFNGYTPSDQEQSSVFDYSRDTLNSEALTHLRTIKTTTESLECIEDGITYDLVITDGTGIERELFSSNKSCNSVEADGFVATEDIDRFIELL